MTKGLHRTADWARLRDSTLFEIEDRPGAIIVRQAARDMQQVKRILLGLWAFALLFPLMFGLGAWIVSLFTLDLFAGLFTWRVWQGLKRQPLEVRFLPILSARGEAAGGACTRRHAADHGAGEQSPRLWQPVRERYRLDRGLHRPVEDPRDPEEQPADGGLSPAGPSGRGGAACCFGACGACGMTASITQDTDEMATVARWGRELATDQRVTCDLIPYGFEDCGYRWALVEQARLPSWSKPIIAGSCGSQIG